MNILAKYNPSLASAYPPFTDIATVLQDLGVTLVNDANDINDIKNIILRTHDYIAIIHRIGVVNALSIFDKLGMSHIVNTIIHLRILQDTCMQIQMIHHRLKMYDIIKAYANNYNVVYNNRLTVIDRAHLQESRLLAKRAMEKGLFVTKIDDNYYYDILNSCTSLTELDAHRDYNYIPSSFATFAPRLRKLVISRSNVTEDHMKLCTNIVELHAYCQKKITTCEPFAKTLKILFAGGTCGITDDALNACINLEELYACDNERITSCDPFACKLRKLNASRTCGITDYGLELCISIEVLNATDNPNITTCNPFARTLRRLNASRTCGITDDGLELCISIEILNAADNSNITTCNPFACTLRKLNASRTCGITDYGLELCISIEVLNATNNPNITTCDPFACTLRGLNASKKCGISDHGLELCTAIEEIVTNPKITTFAPFQNTLRNTHIRKTKWMQ